MEAGVGLNAVVYCVNKRAVPLEGQAEPELGAITVTLDGGDTEVQSAHVALGQSSTTLATVEKLPSISGRNDVVNSWPALALPLENETDVWYKKLLATLTYAEKEGLPADTVLPA